MKSQNSMFIHLAFGFVYAGSLFCGILAGEEPGRFAGIVILPDGSPLPHAKVMVCADNAYTCTDFDALSFAGAAPPMATADEKGAFSFANPSAKYTLAIIHEKGYGEVKDEDFQAKPEIVARPWGRAEGVVMIGSKPAPQEFVTIERAGGTGPHITFSLNDIKADQEGRFIFERVPSIPMRFGRLVAVVEDCGYFSGGHASSSHWSSYDVKPGETLQVQIGGTGRPVTGRFMPPKNDPQQAIAYSAAGWIHLDSEPFQAHDRASVLAQRHYTFQIENDGRFRIEDVPEGKYNLWIADVPRYDKKRDPTERGQPMFRASRQIEIPEMPGGRSDEAFDLGEIETELQTIQ